jgi:DNA-binding transcriptional LysR family regulator
MELRHLRYFVAVAEELHFSRAAAKLRIATPTLSAQIQTLETSLGARLFTRKTRSVVLTSVGKRFLAEAQEVIRRADHAELVARRFAKGEEGTLAVGYILTAAYGGMITASIVDFRASHPNVNVELQRMQTLPQMTALLGGSLDIGFARAPERFPAGLAGFVVDRQPLCLAIPSGHRLAAHSVIEPEMLAGEEFVTTSLEMELGYWSNVSEVVPTDMQVKIVARVPDTTSVLFSVAAGIGIGVLSESLTRTAVAGVTFRKLGGATRTSDHVAVFRRNEASPLIKAFIALMREKTRSLRPIAA